MHIANNILKHNLQNVYFLTGTALAGKTTMGKALANKYGFTYFDENYNGEHFQLFKSICDKKYQPQACKRDDRFMQYSNDDWDMHYNKPAAAIIAERPEYGLNDEYMEVVVIELIKMSQNNKVIADLCMPLKLLVELSDYNRIACLLASPELVTTVNYGSRDDHKSYLEWIMSLNNPEAKIQKQDEIFKMDTQNIYEEVQKYNLFSIIRTSESTVENTLRLLARHFNL